MKAIVAVLTLATLGLAAGGAAAQTTGEVRGTVTSVDVANRVIRLDDGRMYRTSGQSVILVGDTPIIIENLQPGTRIVIRSGEAATSREGRDMSGAQLSPSSPGGGPPSPSGVSATPRGDATEPPAGTAARARGRQAERSRAARPGPAPRASTTVEVELSRTTPWCGGAYAPAAGTNFGSC